MATKDERESIKMTVLVNLKAISDIFNFSYGDGIELKTDRDEVFLRK